MTAPARLLSVRLQGFKSFADRTHVEFGPGISAIVGPNGSGKSNLADALRWALGEQGRALRTRKSEDVVWAGSERRPAVGMADVQLTLDNSDGLLPVEYGVVELGRRLYRSGENDYLLNRQRVRLKDLVDLLDAGHLAENAFLFIGQGMVDQALALRPEERRPLFEEVAGVRRHERRRRRAEEQLVESEANLARVDDILAELRPQARRLAQQAEQQANRRSAADELASAILASAHARWHDAGRRASASADSLAKARRVVDAAMGELLEHERTTTAAAAALDGQVSAESAARTTLDKVRADRAALQLREGRHTAEREATSRERAGLEDARVAAAADVASARQALALPVPEPPSELEAELASLEADLVAALAGAPSQGGATGSAGMSASDAAAIRRLEAARAEDVAGLRRRAVDAERRTSEERTRAAVARTRATDAMTERASAVAARDTAVLDESATRTARERAQGALAEAESSTRAAADRLAGARAAATAATARLSESRRALEAADGAAFSRAARARGGRAIGDGLIIEPSMQRAVDAALAGLGRAQVVPRGAITEIAADRGVAIAAEAVSTPHAPPAADAEAGRRIIEAASSSGGGHLADAVRRDDSGAATRLLARVVWLPDGAACLELQPTLPAGWQAVARDGSLVVGDVATWIRPDGRGLHLQADVDRLAGEVAALTAEVETAVEQHTAAEAAMRAAQTELAATRDREATAMTLRRRAEEAERAAADRADATAREASWLEAQVARLDAEAVRLRAAAPQEADEPRPDSVSKRPSITSSAAEPGEVARKRAVALRARRDALATELAAARSTRADAERRRAQAEAAVTLAERQLEYAARTAGDLAEREARLAIEREDLVAALATVERAVGEAEAGLASIVEAATAERARLRAAEVAAGMLRERVRIAQEGSRIAERDELEARLALEGLREGLLVELAGLGTTGLRYLHGIDAARSATDATAPDATAPDATPAVDADTDAATDDDLAPEALEQALAIAAAVWERTAPPADPPGPSRLASLRRRFHDLGAVNPFAADEYAEVRTRLDALEAQRSDLQGAIERTRELIGELDRLVSDQFRRTFTALERAFDERFQQLFGGGYARLSLTDPDDLASTGIEITARPPGKKAQALAMLSGGERALTAVALLFAMLEVRPVPFCVLDEVDAALDEANIGRFTDALRDLSRNTQCLVITHNRGTIEVADALYGVTVGEDSVSRVISLRLDEATALAARFRGANRTTSRPARCRSRVTERETRPSELEDGLRRSRGGFMSRLRGLLTGEQVSPETWADVEESLIAGDIGASLATTVVDRARERGASDGATAAVRRELAALLLPRDPAWDLATRPGIVEDHQPAVILIVGVNGTGKTTTIGKLAAREAAAGRRVVLAAADTFRAAAAEQLRVWADRAGADIVAHAAGADPAAVVYDALDAAVARRADVVLIDTAGRLHTKSNLMDELAKIRRVIDRRLPGASPETLLVLDATTGQNGLAQAVAFNEAVGLTGIVLTKLDSTARGGIVFAIEQRLGVPVRYAGVGERPEDLVAFDPAAFVDALFEDAA